MCLEDRMAVAMMRGKSRRKNRSGLGPPAIDQACDGKVKFSKRLKRGRGIVKLVTMPGDGCE